MNLPLPTSSGDFSPFLSIKTNAAGRRRGQINNIGNAYIDPWGKRAKWPSERRTPVYDTYDMWHIKCFIVDQLPNSMWTNEKRFLVEEPRSGNWSKSLSEFYQRLTDNFSSINLRNGFGWDYLDCFCYPRAIFHDQRRNSSIWPTNGIIIK